MSKLDAQRAMREARYAEAQARAGKAAAKAPKTTKTTKVPKATVAPVAASEDGLCGHRAISGRTCTRERGHAAKSHRYS